jgi:hypothetical protein
MCIYVMQKPKVCSREFYYLEYNKILPFQNKLAKCDIGTKVHFKDALENFLQ